MCCRYEVKFENGQECGGAYVKLLTKSTQGDLHQFMDKTPYTIMFGPDRCGLDNKVSYIRVLCTAYLLSIATWYDLVFVT